MMASDPLKPIGHTIIGLDQTRSTNSLVMETPNYLANHGLVITARHQTAGRGRVGRKWASVPGLQLQFTVVLHPPLPREQVSIVSLMAGLAVGECLKSLLGLQPLLKWPNDVFLNSRKVCGILVEMKQVDGRPRLALGLGLNCLGAPEDFPPDVRGLLTTLSHEAGTPVEMEVVLQAVLGALEVQYQRLLDGGRAALLRDWSAMAGLPGRAVRFPTTQGMGKGEAVGLSPEGYLLIVTPGGGTHLHASGELEWEA